MITGELYFKDTHLQGLLLKGRCLVSTHIEKLMMINSLEMNDENRNQIADQCNNYSEGKIILTHGTYTMTTTAEFLVEKLKNKTVY